MTTVRRLHARAYVPNRAGFYWDEILVAAGGDTAAIDANGDAEGNDAGRLGLLSLSTSYLAFPLEGQVYLHHSRNFLVCRIGVTLFQG